MQNVSTQSLAVSSNPVESITSSNGIDTKDAIKLRVLDMVVRQLAIRSPKGLTRSLISMPDRDKLITAVRNEYKSVLNLAREKKGEKVDWKERLPEDINSIILQTVDEVITSCLAKSINATNFHSIRSSFNVQTNKGIVNEKVTAVGYNILAIKEQVLGAKLYVGQLERNLRDRQSKNIPPDDKSIVNLKERIMAANTLVAKLEDELAKQTPAIAEANK